MNDKKVYLSNLEWIKIKGECLGKYNNLGIVRGNITIKDGISHEEFLKLLDNNFYILSNNQLQSNWNSLREWLGDLGLADVYAREVLDKMNELESGDNNE